MSSIVNNINELLNPVLFQVVGSTPESIRDSVKNSSLRSNPSGASNFAAACVFAAAVNKSTLETFIAKPELISARGIVSSTFSISGRSNMTGLTLLGHCLLTTTFANSINFCVEFRKKMGQDNIWDGNLDSGSLSDKQKEILKEKKRVTPADTAKLLGSGFLKFTGLVSSGYTQDEANFWGESSGSTGIGSRSAVSSGIPSPPRRSRTTSTVTLSDGSVIPADVAEYYLAINNNDQARLLQSVQREGASKWGDVYRVRMNNDPNRIGTGGSSVIS